MSVEVYNAMIDAGVGLVLAVYVVGVAATLRDVLCQKDKRHFLVKAAPLGWFKRAP